MAIAKLSTSQFFEGIISGNVAILSKAITLVESTRVEDQIVARDLVERIMPYSGKSFRLGITGVPGVGKSTFIESFGQLLVSMGKKLAVLTIDPSSTISKGSILGDKTRMEKLSVTPGVYIRPSPSGGTLGGVARKTKESIMLCEAAGYDFIIIETVGVGQSETTVHQLADFFLLLMLAGAGDELQGIKRGIMELADGIAITKTDGSNIEKAKMARAEYANAIHFFPPTTSGWIPKVLTCSALHQSGLEEILKMLESYQNQTILSGYFSSKRAEQSVFWFEHLLNDQLLKIFLSKPDRIAQVQSLKQQVKEGGISPYSAVLQLVREFSV
jgi:LAO/AO transport system kinase